MLGVQWFEVYAISWYSASVLRYFLAGERKNMLTLEQVREALQDRVLLTISKKTDLSYDTVWRIANNRDKSVSYEVVKRLSDYLETADKEVSNG